MLHRFMFVLVSVCMLVIAGCGGADGPGVDSPSAALTLDVDTGTVTGGNPIVATVTLTSSIIGRAVNGLNVVVRSSDNTVIVDTSGTTNTDGVARIVLRTNKTSSIREVTLVATLEGVTQSTSKIVVVNPPLLPVMTVSLPTTSTSSFKAGGGYGTIVLSGTFVKFIDGNSIPIPGQVIDLYVDSITGQMIGEYAFFVPTAGAQIIAPPGVLHITTDSNGMATIPMGVVMSIPGAAGTENNMVVNWRAVTNYLGTQITTSGQSAFKITGS